MEKEKNFPKTPEQKVCQCGSLTETKRIQTGWGSAPIQVCTNPDCQCKKKKAEDTPRPKVGWGK